LDAWLSQKVPDGAYSESGAEARDFMTVRKRNHTAEAVTLVIFLRRCFKHVNESEVAD
jgi:hypothetical protein